jgi:hypothetical protein
MSAGASSPAAACPVCTAELVTIFANGQGWVEACPDCALAEPRGAVLAWPSDDGESIILSAHGAPVVLAVHEARQICGALGGALALRDNAVVEVRA